MRMRFVLTHNIHKGRDIMHRKNLNFVGIALILLTALFLFIPVVQAEERPDDLTVCYIGKLTLLHGSKEVTVFASNYKGIVLSNTEDKFWDSFTQMGVGVVHIKAGKFSGNGYNKLQSPKGDIALAEWVGSGKPGEGTWKFIHGTGALEGITGSGKYHPITKSKPIEKGTFQTCYKVTGTSELPKPK